MQKELTMKHYDKRVLAHIEIEAETPIIIGSGNKTCLTDAEILKDVNGLPFIPGTSIAGVLRHAVNKELAEKIFGSSNTNEPRGSEIIFSEAKLICGDGEIIDGLYDTDKDEFLEKFQNLPKRNHVRISHRGVAENTGKFDGEVIYKGTRFAFEIELLSKSETSDSENGLDTLIEVLKSDTFRIGGGTRKGFGKIKLVSVRTKEFDLNSESQLGDYLKTSSRICKRDWKEYTALEKENPARKRVTYTLTLNPQDFFYFGSGLGDDEVDDTPVREKIIVWDNVTGSGSFKTAILIPASSLKGALAHRVAFHYNLSKGKFADQIVPDELEQLCGNNNPAVRRLFGYNDKGKLKRGCTLFSDILEVDDKGPKEYKILNHVKIDRFTGGAMDGALFSEKVVNGKRHIFKTTITIIDEEAQTVSDGEKYDDPSFDQCIAAFEAALKDINDGTLPLGGGSGRGHGIFKCEFSKEEN